MRYPTDQLPPRTGGASPALALHCPRCDREYSFDPERPACAHCGGEAPVREGILSVVQDCDYFYGEISREQMREVVHIAQERGWPEAMAGVMERAGGEAMAEYIAQYIGDETRAAWKFLLDLPEGGTALDFGCGWGATSLSLARSVSHVISSDLTFERLLLLRERARDRGLNNMSFVHAGDRLPLPLAGSSVDLAVLNGVMEWFPVSHPGDPRAAQLALLKDLRRILKPGGQLYIGIENRIGFNYFLGRPDDHSGLRFTSIMPRRVADLWSRYRKGRPYRTYTYSPKGYLRLLREAGFDRVGFYCPYPDYREFTKIVASSARHEIRRLFRPKSLSRKVVVEALHRTQTLRTLFPSFGMVANPVEGRPSYIERLLDSLPEGLRGRFGPPQRISALPTELVLAFCPATKPGEQGAVLHLPLTETAERRSVARRNNLRDLREQWAGRIARILHLMPAPLHSGYFEGQFFSAVTWLPGVEAESVLRQAQDELPMYSRVVDWLLEFQSPGRALEHHDVDALVARFESLYRAVSGVAPGVCDGLGDSDALAERIRGRLGDLQVPSVLNHGDFYLGNILVDPESHELTGVVDWDLLETDGIPLTDILYLLLRRRLEARHSSFARAVAQLADDSQRDPVESAVLGRYLERFDLPPAYVPVALLMMVLQQLAQNADYRPMLLGRLCEGLPAVISQILPEA